MDTNLQNVKDPLKLSKYWVDYCNFCIGKPTLPSFLFCHKNVFEKLFVFTNRTERLHIAP